MADFTKDNPCTKLHIHNCFVSKSKTKRGYVRVPIVQVYDQIGKRVAGIMVQNGRLDLYEVRGVEYGELTEAGADWLHNGIIAWMRNHPNKAGDVINPPREAAPVAANATGRRRVVAA